MLCEITFEKSKLLLAEGKKLGMGVEKCYISIVDDLIYPDINWTKTMA